MRLRVGAWVVAVVLVAVGAGATATGAAARDRGGRWVERRSWAQQFERVGVTGTALVFDEDRGRFFVHDRRRAQDRFIPASTFKVVNALVALQNGNVSDEFEVLRWDGVEREIPAWNRDHSLASGMRFSVVWFYQEMARRTGEARMQEWVDRIGYGNRNLSGGIEQFWLTGGLRISAPERSSCCAAWPTTPCPSTTATRTRCGGCCCRAPDRTSACSARPAGRSSPARRTSDGTSASASTGAGVSSSR
jgi:hypothetical protein